MIWKSDYFVDYDLDFPDQADLAPLSNLELSVKKFQGTVRDQG